MNTLLSTYGAGSIALIVLFLLCFLLVHLARLVKFGWNAQKKPKKQPPPQPQKETPPEKSQAPEPVYYIVERKKRTKSNYSEPKQIRFK